MKSRAAAIAVLVVEVLLSVAALLFALAAVLGSLHDTADASLLGVGWAVGALVAAAVFYGKEWLWRLLVLALIAGSAVLSALDLAFARNWFE